MSLLVDIDDVALAMVDSAMVPSIPGLSPAEARPLYARDVRHCRPITARGACLVHVLVEAVTVAAQKGDELGEILPVCAHGGGRPVPLNQHPLEELLHLVGQRILRAGD
jgi:hypothetical protein